MQERGGGGCVWEEGKLRMNREGEEKDEMDSRNEVVSIQWHKKRTDVTKHEASDRNKVEEPQQNMQL